MMAGDFTQEWYALGIFKSAVSRFFIVEGYSFLDFSYRDYPLRNIET